MDELGVLLRLICALEKGRSTAVVTVVSTTGSTPGKVGYQMLVFSEDGQTAGTVGGGLLEARMIDAARSLLAAPTTEVFRFDLGKDLQDENGICGGAIEFLVETFDRTSLPVLRQITAAGRDRGHLLISAIAPGRPPRKVLLSDGDRTEGCAAEAPPADLAAAVREAAIQGSCPKRLSCCGEEVFAQSLAPCPPVVVFGAGHVAGFICQYATSVGFRVTVLDDRPEYASKARFPDAEAVLIHDFRRILDGVVIDEGSYVVIVTRGHAWDETVLEQVLGTDARYIGMIGSRRKSQVILDNLRHKGTPEEAIQRVYSPIGLAIGAVTPEEIALSIVSELVKVRRLGHGSGVGHMTSTHQATSPGGSP